MSYGQNSTHNNLVILIIRYVSNHRKRLFQNIFFVKQDYEDFIDPS
jgi:hypothetical protein